MLPSVPEIPKTESGPNGPKNDREAPETAAGFEAPKTAEATAVEVPAATAPPHSAAAPVSPPKDDTTINVERVLEDDLQQAYHQLPPAKKVEFKKEGERVAAEIAGMIKSLRIRAARVLKLITRWLRLIPGVNKFFLIQQAKIKTDRVLALAEEEKKKRGT